MQLGAETKRSWNTDALPVIDPGSDGDRLRVMIQTARKPCREIYLRKEMARRDIPSFVLDHASGLGYVKAFGEPGMRIYRWDD